jgi:hypothetical protein
MINRRLAVTFGIGLMGILTSSVSWPALAQSTSSSTVKDRSTDVIKLLVMDKSTDRPLSNRSTQIHSDNGIRCITTPCPTNSKNWQGRTNHQGVVFIPQQIMQSSTTLTMKGYTATDLVRDLQHQPSGKAAILLVPAP